MDTVLNLNWELVLAAENTATTPESVAILSDLPDELHVFVQVPVLDGTHVNQPDIYWSTDATTVETHRIPGGALKINVLWSVQVAFDSWLPHHYEVAKSALSEYGFDPTRKADTEALDLPVLEMPDPETFEGPGDDRGEHRNSMHGKDLVVLVHQASEEEERLIDISGPSINELGEGAGLPGEVKADEAGAAACGVQLKRFPQVGQTCFQVLESTSPSSSSSPVMFASPSEELPEEKYCVGANSGAGATKRMYFRREALESILAAERSPCTASVAPRAAIMALQDNLNGISRDSALAVLGAPAVHTNCIGKAICGWMAAARLPTSYT
ncbi:hypothetical protein FB451DRAFT_1162450 [Mycena latifolia]|nr:hypothetical protein FB451DRAFT_1162450 [Mycena latifolia]